ncbi:MAG TPA: hypothetical protein VGR85_02795 [Candidatus Limnocylindria bacterium]|jgi:hypothetical protein|nr:hypothetical protein [Candidatus Limnocylindria bacterium]
MKRATRKKIQPGDAFEELLAKEFPTPGERQAFEADVQAKLAAAQALAAVERKRTKAGLTQAAMAARMRTPAPVLSRLTNARTPNPTFATFSRALGAVGLGATIKIHKARRGQATLRVVS